MVYHLELALYFVTILAVIDRNFSSCLYWLSTTIIEPRSSGLRSSTLVEYKVGQNAAVSSNRWDPLLIKKM